MLLIKLIRLEIHFLVQFQSNNMKLLNYKSALFIFSLMLIMSCDPGSEPIGCTDETRETFVMPTILEDYFGMYQEGNWWVYYNEDSTKMDSLFVTDYEGIMEIPEFGCVQYEWKNYTINAKHLASNDRVLKATIEGSSCCSWRVIWAYQDDGGFSISTREKNNSIVLNFFPPRSEIVDSIEINSILYSNVLSIQTSASGDRLYFAQNIGLIRFKLSGEIFNLKKHQIQ